MDFYDFVLVYAGGDCGDREFIIPLEVPDVDGTYDASALGWNCKTVEIVLR
jgi:hypothetical protein